MARSEQSACRFRGPSHGFAAVARRDAGGDEMRQRIDHLEGLVKRLINEGQGEGKYGEGKNGPSTPESSKGEASEVACAGTTVMDGVRSVYRGGDEWEDVLSEVF